MTEYLSRDDTYECLATAFGDRMAEDIIKLIPIADVHPVKHGHWEYYKNNGIYDTYKCSICKESLELPMDADISQEIRYCPNCGAKMVREG